MGDGEKGWERGGGNGGRTSSRSRFAAFPLLRTVVVSNPGDCPLTHPALSGRGPTGEAAPSIPIPLIRGTAPDPDAIAKCRSVRESVERAYGGGGERTEDLSDWNGWREGAFDEVERRVEREEVGVVWRGELEDGGDVGWRRSRRRDV